MFTGYINKYDIHIEDGLKRPLNAGITIYNDHLEVKILVSNEANDFRNRKFYEVQYCIRQKKPEDAELGFVQDYHWMQGLHEKFY